MVEQGANLNLFSKTGVETLYYDMIIIASEVEANAEAGKIKR